MNNMTKDINSNQKSGLIFNNGVKSEKIIWMIIKILLIV